MTDTAPLDADRLARALWTLMKRNGWRISTGLDDLPPNAVVEAIAREYAVLAATSREEERDAWLAEVEE